MGEEPRKRGGGRIAFARLLYSLHHLNTAERHPDDPARGPQGAAEAEMDAQPPSVNVVFFHEGGVPLWWGGVGAPALW